MRKPFSIPSLVLCPTWDDSTAFSSPAPTRHNATYQPSVASLSHYDNTPVSHSSSARLLSIQITIRTAIFTTDDVLLRFVSTQIHVLQQSGCSVVLDLCVFYFETRIGLFSITWNKTLFLHLPLKKNFFLFFPPF